MKTEVRTSQAFISSEYASKKCLPFKNKK